MSYPRLDLYPSLSIFPEEPIRPKIVTSDFTQVKEMINLMLSKRWYGDAPLKDYTVTHNVQTGKVLKVEDANDLLNPYKRMISDDARQEVSESERIHSGDMLYKDIFQQELEVATMYSNFNLYHNNQNESGCKNNCSGLCVSSCANLCKGNCTGSCGQSCAGSCSTRCQSDCNSTCSFDCTSTCTYSCQNSDKTSYTSSCPSSCGSGCASMCSKSCQRISSNDIYLSFFDCSSCTAACGGVQPCESRCESNCFGKCSSTCANTCQSTCGQDCILGCSGKQVQKNWINDPQNHMWDELPFKNQVVLKADGTWKIPSGVTKIAYFLVGGGGGSAGTCIEAYSTGEWYYVYGSGGGGGGYTTSGILETLGDGTDKIKYSVGEGGSAGALNSNGGDGGRTILQYIQGSTTIKSVTANGGKGSKASPYQSITTTYGGAGGSGGGDGVPPKYIYAHRACFNQTVNFWECPRLNGGVDGGDGRGFCTWNEKGGRGWSVDNHEWSQGGIGQGTSTTCPWNGKTYGCGGGGGGYEHYGNGSFYLAYDGGLGFNGAGQGESWDRDYSIAGDGRIPGDANGTKKYNRNDFMLSASLSDGEDGTGGGAGGCITHWQPRDFIGSRRTGHRGGNGTLLIFY